MAITSLSKSIQEKLRSGINISSLKDCVIQLVFNSLDANSTSIAIHVNQLTHTIQVIDNGHGISQQNLKLVGIRYRTNKHKKTQESKKNKYGYRGEALASIRNMSKTLIITSKVIGSNQTYRKTYEFSKPQAVISVAQRTCSGTTVTVKRFLYNLPVRQNQNESNSLDNLKSELAIISLMHPKCSFSLRNNKEILFRSSKTKYVIDRICYIYGNEYRGHFMPFSFAAMNIKVTGLLSQISYSHKNIQLVYVNKRNIKKTFIHDAVNNLLLKTLFKNVTNNQKNVLSPNKFKFGAYVINIKCPQSETHLIDDINKVIEFKDPNKIIYVMENGFISFFKSVKIITKDNVDFKSDLPKVIPRKKKFQIKNSYMNDTIRGFPAKRIKNKSPVQIKIETASLKQNEITNNHNNYDINGHNETDLNEKIGKNILLDIFLKSTAYYKYKVDNKMRFDSSNSITSCSRQSEYEEIYQFPNRRIPKISQIKKFKTPTLSIINHSEIQNQNYYYPNLSKKNYEINEISFETHITPQKIKKNDYNFQSIILKKSKVCLSNIKQKKYIFSNTESTYSHRSCTNLKNQKIAIKNIDNKYHCNRSKLYAPHSIKPFYFITPKNLIMNKFAKKRKSLFLKSLDFLTYNNIKRTNVKAIKPVHVSSLITTWIDVKNKLLHHLKQRQNKFIKNNNFMQNKIKLNKSHRSTYMNIKTSREIFNNTNSYDNNSLQQISNINITPVNTVTNDNNFKFIYDSSVKKSVIDNNTYTTSSYFNTFNSQLTIYNKNRSCQSKEKQSPHLNYNHHKIQNELQISFTSTSPKEITLSVSSKKNPDLDFDLQTKINTFVPYSTNPNLNEYHVNRNYSIMNTPKGQNFGNDNLTLENIINLRKNNLTNYIISPLQLKTYTICSPEIETNMIYSTNENSENCFIPVNNIDIEQINNITTFNSDVTQKTLKYLCNSIKRNNAENIKEITSKLPESFIKTFSSGMNLLTPNCEYPQKPNSISEQNNKSKSKKIPESVESPYFIKRYTSKKHLDTPNKNPQDNSIWITKFDETGNRFFVNPNTGFVNFDDPINGPTYLMTKRPSFVPKGMSPILKSLTKIESDLSPKARINLYETMTKNIENDQLRIVKWMTLFNEKDFDIFFKNLYEDKKHFENPILDIGIQNNKTLKPNVTEIERHMLTNANVINQFDNKFIVTKLTNEKKSYILVLFDQHAVHERIRLEELLKSYYNNEAQCWKSTKCDFAVDIDLTDTEFNIYKMNKNRLDKWGLHYDINESKMLIIVSTIPSCLSNKIKQTSDDYAKQIKIYFKKLVEEYINTSLSDGFGLIISNSIVNIIKNEACKGALKFGDILTTDECTKLIDRLKTCDLPFQCAHGRPTLIPILNLNDVSYSKLCIAPPPLRFGNLRNSI